MTNEEKTHQLLSLRLLGKQRLSAALLACASAPPIRWGAMDDLLRRLERAGQLYDDLATVLTPELLGARLGDLPSSTIGEQLWCVVGARESYTRAAREGGWKGFTSSLDSASASDPEAVARILRSSLAEVRATLESGLDAAGQRWLGDLLEHETQHHGQLIRYLYGLGIDRPVSWRERYALE